MTRTLVERLRAHPGPGDSVTVQFRTMLAQRQEAADEIERLTADNKQLRDDFWKERERVDLLRAEAERLQREIGILQALLAQYERP